MRFGKLPRRSDYRTLRFQRYLTAALPPAPASYDALDRLEAAGLLPDYGHVAELFPMDGNDALGDCTIAALAHAVTVHNGLVGARCVPPAEAVVRLYRELTGGEDTGLDELTVLNHWRQNADQGERILAYAALDPRNHEHVKLAIWLFGGVYLGFQVQRDCMAEFDAGRIWRPGPLLNEGHAVFAVGYDVGDSTVPPAVAMLTWGSLQFGTWEWWDACVDEAYVLLPPQAAQAGFAPGFDFAQLQSDLALVTDDGAASPMASQPAASAGGSAGVTGAR